MGIRVYMEFRDKENNFVRECSEETALEIVRALSGDEQITQDELRAYKDLYAEYERSWGNPNADVSYRKWKAVDDFPYSSYYGMLFDPLGFGKHNEITNWLADYCDQETYGGICTDKYAIAHALNQICFDMRIPDWKVAAVRLSRVVDALSWS